MKARCYTRRHFLAGQAMGMGSLALSWLLQRDRAAYGVPPESTGFNLLPKLTPRPARAKAMISLFMQGGPSHHDLFDFKPEMVKYDGKKFPGDNIKYDDPAHASSKVMASPWKFAKHGQCGMEISELLPHLAGVVDDVCLIRSMHTGVNNHPQSVNAMQTGRPLAGRPSLGSWVTYALGSEADNLPAFVVMADTKSPPVEGVRNWSAGWLPSIYQGTAIRDEEPRILNLDAPANLRGRAQEDYLSYLGKLNADHLAEHPGETDLAARISSYELAARMQVAAKDALDLSQESEETKRMYGLSNPACAAYGQKCLIARRLVERGVRFIQIFTRNQLWDHHRGIIAGLPAACALTDQPSAALVRDLKQRGLLESTVVHWGGEMGRLPVIQYDQGRDKVGRDHNTYGFSMWVAGGGFKGGLTYGETDAFGHHAVKDIVTHSDYHATLLHLFGLEHEALTFKRNGSDQSLTDGQKCQIVRGILG